MLKFSPANAKISALKSVIELKPYLEGRKVYSLDLLSGWSCPYADKCLSKVHEIDGKLKLVDGPNTVFRCFSASQEVVYQNAYRLRKYNFDLLRSLRGDAVYDLLSASMPKNLGILRWHVDGDFFNNNYFRAAIKLAYNNPDRLFYAYTKSLPFWVKNLDILRDISNFILTASYGGKYDHYIPLYNLRSAIVVNHPEDTTLPIDHTEEYAVNPTNRYNDFALLLHGIMPVGSIAGKAIARMKRENIKFSYSRKPSGTTQQKI